MSYYVDLVYDILIQVKEGLADSIANVKITDSGKTYLNLRRQLGTENFISAGTETTASD